MRAPSLSFVIPAYNEEKSVTPLYHEIKQVVADLIKQKKVSDFEVIFINDGSRDRTQKVLEKLKKAEGKRLKIIEFRRNFAKAEAYKAGFELVSNDLIFTMDADLQDNPKNIPDFLNRIGQGYDLVVGWKFNRRDPIHKTLPSKLFNFIMQKQTGLGLHDFDNGYRCMKKEILPHLGGLYEGLYRYIPVYANAKGYRIAEVKVNHRARKFGASKYGFSRLFKGAFDLITIKFLFVYLKRPLHFFGGFGTLFFSTGLLISVYLTMLKFFFNQLIGNRPLLAFGVLLMTIGVQFVLFGLLGEMIANISRKEKRYSIRKTL